MSSLKDNLKKHLGEMCQCVEEMCQINFFLISLPPLYDGAFSSKGDERGEIYHEVPITSSSIVKLNNSLSVQFHPLEILVQI